MPIIGEMSLVLKISRLSFAVILNGSGVFSVQSCSGNWLLAIVRFLYRHK